jgi:lipopolysaccharide export system protein LptA
MNNTRLSLILLASVPLLLQAASVTDLRADSAMLDGKTGEYFYRGNALLSQENVRINADEMQATQDENGNLQSGRFRGNPAVLTHTDPVTGATSEARALEILYDTASGRIELLGTASLVQTDPKLARQMRLEGDRIELVETGEQLNDLTATGQPVVFSRQETNALPVEGRANQLRYQGAKEHLVLEGNAKLQQGPTQFEHVVIEYDGLSKRITAPKRDGQQVKITRVQDSATNTPAPTPPTNEKPEPSANKKKDPQ